MQPWDLERAAERRNINVQECNLGIWKGQFGDNRVAITSPQFSNMYLSFSIVGFFHCWIELDWMEQKQAQTHSFLDGNGRKFS